MRSSTARAVDLRRIHNAYMLPRNAAQERLDQRIVRASEHQHVGVVKSIRKSLSEIDLRDLLGNGMVNPSLFDKGHQQRTGFLARIQAGRPEPCDRRGC